MLRLTLLTALALGAVMAQESNPFGADPQAAEIGRGVFRIYCAPCHGILARGGRGPDLTRGVFAAGDKDSDLYRTILNGVAGTEMSSYSELGNEVIWRIVAYIRSAGRHESTAVPGDAAHGEKLFWEKGQCGRCHSVGARGSHLGPDLTRIGRQRSLDYLKASVLDPSDDISPGYATLTVITNEAKKISGIEKGLDSFSGQLIDLSGKFYSFQRDEVKSITREARSVMPAYTRTFNEAELTDLLAYLASLRAQETRP
jgi:putative heme-binding domain-containing protein